MSHLLTETELLTAFGYTRRGDLQKALDEQHIKYHLGKGGRIVSTLEAINLPLIGNTPAADNEKVSFV